MLLIQRKEALPRTKQIVVNDTMRLRYPVGILTDSNKLEFESVIHHYVVDIYCSALAIDEDGLGEAGGFADGYTSLMNQKYIIAVDVLLLHYLPMDKHIVVKCNDELVEEGLFTIAKDRS